MSEEYARDTMYPGLGRYFDEASVTGPVYWDATELEKREMFHDHDEAQHLFVSEAPEAVRAAELEELAKKARIAARGGMAEQREEQLAAITSNERRLMFRRVAAGSSILQLSAEKLGLTTSILNDAANEERADEIDFSATYEALVQAEIACDALGKAATSGATDSAGVRRILRGGNSSTVTTRLSREIKPTANIQVVGFGADLAVKPIRRFPEAFALREARQIGESSEPDLSPEDPTRYVSMLFTSPLEEDTAGLFRIKARNSGLLDESSINSLSGGRYRIIKDPLFRSRIQDKY